MHFIIFIFVIKKYNREKFNKFLTGFILASWAVPVAEGLRTILCSSLNGSSSRRCGFKPSLGHIVRQAKFCSRVVRSFFSGFSRFHLSLKLSQLKMSEIILTGHNAQIKKKNNNKMAF